MSFVMEMTARKKLNINQVCVKSVVLLCAMCVKKVLYLQKI